MTTWFVSRHEGALLWMREHGPRFDVHVPHLEVSQAQPGDVVIGTLPVNLASQVCGRGARYLHLSVQMPAEWRGQELSAQMLCEVKAHLQEFFIFPCPESP